MTTKHNFLEESREHIISWDSKGRHCSTIDCEINEETHQKELEKNKGGGINGISRSKSV